MGRILALAVALTFGLALALAYSASSSAQPDGNVLRACAPGEKEIEARGLPAVFEVGACPVGDRVISDNGAKAILPPRGESLHVETLNVSGAQELVIEHRADGEIKLAKVGDDSAAVEPEGSTTRASGPSECSDRAFTSLSYRVEPGLSYYFNRATTPREITPTAAETAVRRATANVQNTRNACRLGDRVPVGMTYAGPTRALANIAPSGACSANDGRSVVSFGGLSSGALAVACTNYVIGSGPDRVTASDIRVNTGPTWTTAPTARSCKNRYDLESVLTHERGHTFGLGHVSESAHRNLTMSTRINGPCDASQRTLGRGDVLGLDGKY